MSRYLLVPFPLHGHVNPMVSLATELVRRGEHVQVAISAPFAEVFHAVGAEVVALDIEPRETIPDMAGRRSGLLRTLAQRRRERLRLVRQLRHVWSEVTPAVVVADVLSVWGIRAAGAEGTPLAVLNVTHAVSEQMLVEDARAQFGPQVARLLHTVGLTRMQHGLHRKAVDRADLVLVNVPEQLQPARHTFDGRFRFVGPLRCDTGSRGDQNLPWDRIRGGRTLYVSAGSLYTRAPSFFRKIADAFAGTGWFVVLATSGTDPAELGELPDNVVARRFVPQSAVLEHSAVFITHAGMNSAMDGVTCGIPMVFVPKAYDQRRIAETLAGLGVGILLDADADGGQFRNAVSTLVADDRTRSALADLAERIGRIDGPAAAADALRDVVATA